MDQAVAMDTERQVIRDMNNQSEPKEVELSFDDFFNVELVDLDMAVETKEEAIAHLSELLDKHGVLSHQDDYIVTVYEREVLGITGMGDGIAIPHGKSDGVIKPAIAIGRNTKLIEWESYDNQPVNFIFLFAIPGDKEHATTHLRMLAKLAGKLGDVERVARLKQVKTYDELLEVFKS